MVKRKRIESKTLRLSTEEKRVADMVKKGLIVGDTHLYTKGVEGERIRYRMKCRDEDDQFIKNQLLAANRRGLSPDARRRIYGEDYEGSLLQQRLGNLSTQIRNSAAAMLFHTISAAEWAILSEKEKNALIESVPDDYKANLPGRRDE